MLDKIRTGHLKASPAQLANIKKQLENITAAPAKLEAFRREWSEKLRIPSLEEIEKELLEAPPLSESAEIVALRQQLAELPRAGLEQFLPKEDDRDMRGARAVGGQDKGGGTGVTLPLRQRGRPRYPSTPPTPQIVETWNRMNQPESIRERGRKPTFSDLAEAMHPDEYHQASPDDRKKLYHRVRRAIQRNKQHRD
jgi:hypothetical protein